MNQDEQIDREQYMFAKSKHADHKFSQSNFAERIKKRRAKITSAAFGLALAIIAIWTPWAGSTQVFFFALSLLFLLNSLRIHGQQRRLLRKSE